jgi:hypothetical protein
VSRLYVLVRAGVRALVALVVAGAFPAVLLLASGLGEPW